MRTKIALRNLYISQTLIILFLIFAYFLWFPHSFTQLGGFNKTALMLIFADLVLGPLLVFIIFKEGKKYLTFDINILLAIQVGAFAFGAYSLFLKHPAYAVFTGDRFSLTNVSDIYPQQSFLVGIKNHFLSSPKFVIATLPKDAKAQSDLLLNIVFNQTPDIDKRPGYYKPLEQKDFKTLLSKSIPIEHLLQNNEEKFAAFYDQYGGKPSDYAYFPLSGNNKKNVIWIFSRHNLQPIGIVDSDPWVIAKR
jgi:hypothetical protein